MPCSLWVNKYKKYEAYGSEMKKIKTHFIHRQYNVYTYIPHPQKSTKARLELF